ncbi:hypothetical protein SEEN176_12108 [Salmonella enterica subsp. enterica serovar Newport str. CVM 4176]|nr:hypothetical protein SEEN176_12108 [Salmonella enterica subsp. enterica serovar Newport str. CVM 4176]
MFLLPASAFNRQLGIFALAGFIHNLTQVFSHVEMVEGDFLNRVG